MFLTSGTKTIYDKHIVAPNRDWSTKLYYYYNGTWYSLGTTNLQSLQISDYSTDGSNITMGTVVGGKLTVNLIKVASSVVGRLTKGTAIKIKLTLNSSAATSGITLTSRVFVIDDSKLTLRAGGSYNVSLTAYDFSYKMTDKFVASANNLTAKQILTEIGNKYGFTIGLSVDDAIAEFESLYPTTFTPLADYTCKQTIGYMAGCYGCFAYFDEELQLQFAWYESNGDIVDSSRIFNGNSYVSEMEEREIVMLETGTSDNPIVVPNNAKGFSINFENPYITQTQAEAIYNKRIADGKLIFKIGKLSYRGSPLNSPGAIISVKDINRGKYPFYIMKRTLRYDGGLSETIECQGESETTINYKLTSPTQQRINRALSRMEEAIKKATDIITQTKGSVFELIPIDENDPSLGNSGWKLYSTEIGSNNLILANSSGIGFSSNGGQSFNAMALYIDEYGVGHINANCIDVGKLSANVIDTSTLVVSKSNVDGLDTELEALLDAAEEANKKAGNAQTTANTAKSNASTALSTANSAKNALVNLCTDNNMTLVDGAKIYTGSIAANSIDVSKISAGTGELINSFYNGDFSESSNSVPGWDGYNTAITRESGYVKAAYTLSNLLSVEDSEFYSTKNWVATNCSITKPYNDVDYIKVTPNNTSYWAIIATKAYLEKGKRYSVSAQINPQGWNSTNSSYANSCIGIHCNGTFYQTQYTSYSNFSPATDEINVEWVFDYTGDSGNVDVGLFFRGMLTSSGGVVSVNVAWVAVASASGRNTRFYSSKKDWLKSSYQTSNLINSGNYINTAEKYIAYISNNFTFTYGSQLQIFFQKKRMENGKRYVIVARIKVHNLTTVNSDGLLGVWGQNSLGLSHSPIGMYINGKNESGYITVKFVFDYEGNTGTNDVGLCWKGLLNDISNPCALRFSWIQLYQDDTASLGFYCSDESWLADDYKETNLITDSSEISTYNKKPALAVVNDNLYFFGKVQSAIGNIGFLKYTTEEIVAETSLQVYEDASVADLNQQYAFNTSFKIQKPNEILDNNDIDSYKSQNGSHLFSLYEFASTKNIHYVSTGDAWHKSIVSATGLNARSDSGSVVYGSNGITIDGSTILKREDLIALKKLVE